MAIAITTSNTNPLSDSNSFLFQKTGGANDQGKGVSYDFTVDNASKAKVMKISFDYIVNSGTFTAGGIGPSGADSDVIVYVYDITNSQLIQPSSFKLFSNSSTVPDSYSGYFQTAYNSTSYRLIFHQATSTTNNFELKIDSIKVERTNYQYGTPVTDWTWVTPTAGASGTIRGTTTAPTFGTIVVNKLGMRRVGGNMELIWNYKQSTAGTAGTGDYLLDISQFGVQIDTTNLPANSATAASTDYQSTVGTFYYTDSGGSGIGNISVYSATQLKCVMQFASSSLASSTNAWRATYGGFSGASVCIAMHISVPILGWSSSVQMSDSADTRVVSAKIGGTSSTVTSGGWADIIFTSKDHDTHSAYNTTTGIYTVPVSGKYRVYSQYASAGTAGSFGLIEIQKNGSGIARGSDPRDGSRGIYEPKTSGIADFVAGDQIKVRSIQQSVPGTQGITNDAGVSFVTIERLSGPTAIAASETVAASYYASANTAASTSAPFNFDTKIYDSHSAVTVGSAWKFTAPIAGVYSGSVYINASIPVYILLYKNGSFYMSLGYGPVNAISTLPFDIKLNSGDYIEVRASASSTANGGSLASNLTSWISIKKIGLL